MWYIFKMRLVCKDSCPRPSVSSIRLALFPEREQAAWIPSHLFCMKPFLFRKMGTVIHVQMFTSSAKLLFFAFLFFFPVRFPLFLVLNLWNLTKIIKWCDKLLIWVYVNKVLLLDLSYMSSFEVQYSKYLKKIYNLWISWINFKWNEMKVLFICMKWCNNFVNVLFNVLFYHACSYWKLTFLTSQKLL